jgi:predicted RNA binding protein YcfA (HicA-like mRNA interferase family)
MKVREIIRRLHDDGWVKIGQTGSHRQYVHPTKPGRVTVAGKLSKDLKKKTLKSILRQAGLGGTS